MSKVLVIGGAGFIGTHLVKTLTQGDDDCIDIVDNFSRASEQGTKLIEADKVRYIEMDVANDFQSELLESVYDEVYLLASVVGVDFVLEHPTYVLTENLKILSNIFNWVVGGGAKRILLTSTSEVYVGAVEQGLADIPTAESVPLVFEDISHPRFTYAVTKAYGEALFLNAAREFEFETVVLRYHNVYGPNMGNRHVLPHLYARFQNESRFTIYGGEQTRSFNHVSDAIDATVMIMKKGTSGEIYHVGTDVETTIDELSRFVGDEMGYNGEYRKGPAYPGSVKRRSPDITKLRALGYSPKVDWKTGVKQYLAEREK